MIQFYISDFSFVAKDTMYICYASFDIVPMIFTESVTCEMMFLKKYILCAKSRKYQRVFEVCNT